jgi:hypothetical protein
VLERGRTWFGARLTACDAAQCAAANAGTSQEFLSVSQDSRRGSWAPIVLRYARSRSSGVVVGAEPRKYGDGFCRNADDVLRGSIIVSPVKGSEP